MEIKKSELKNIIKECVAEVLTENKPMTFAEACEYVDKIGIVTEEIGENQYNKLIEGVVTTNNYDNIKLILD